MQWRVVLTPCSVIIFQREHIMNVVGFGCAIITHKVVKMLSSLWVGGFSTKEIDFGK